MEITTVKRFFDARAALFIDARDPAEYEAGHIPGALRLTNAEAQGEPDRLKSLPVQGRPIIAYCEGGACEASIELARTLIDAGYQKVLVYSGGYPEWSAAGYPVERGNGGR
jgi:rhodanese-related sulfurtransferase